MASSAAICRTSASSSLAKVTSSSPLAIFWRVAAVQSSAGILYFGSSTAPAWWKSSDAFSRALRSSGEMMIRSPLGARLVTKEQRMLALFSNSMVAPAMM